MKRILLVLIAILCLSQGFAFAEGTAVEIASADDLLLLAEDPDGSFVLTEDIYLPPDFAWEPPVFRGRLDGQGHAIYNVSSRGVCSRTRTVYDGNYKEYEGVFAGFFGILDGGLVENLNLVGTRISVTDSDRCVFAGLLAGLMDSGAVVRNCCVGGICEVQTSGPCFGTGGFAGYGSGRIENSIAESTLICIDTDAEYKDEQFLGGAYAAGFIDLADCIVTVDGYDSDHGYVHDGGLVGMYIIYPKGASYAGQIVRNHVSGRIRFFEDNRDRRAYCAPYIGEVLQWTYEWGGCTEDFERDEVFEYGEDLLPCTHDLRPIVTEPSFGVKGCTKWVCDVCGYSYVADYTAPLLQEFRLLEEPSPNADELLESAGLAEAAAGLAGESSSAGGTLLKALAGFAAGAALAAVAAILLRPRKKKGRH
ncbi:MAG: hypothetical protein K5981_05895 [Clostridia bacterium]|nr:hypothetical protein [Clostridia bacterium]